MDGKDVLKRALHLIKENKLRDAYDCQGGENCPYCAIGQAKTELDEEQGAGLSTSECIDQLISGWGFVETEEDRPLVEARTMLGESDFSPPFIKEEVIKKIEKML